MISRFIFCIVREEIKLIFFALYNAMINNFVKKGKTYNRIRICMSNTFGFGGCNVSLIIGERHENH